MKSFRGLPFISLLILWLFHYPTAAIQAPDPTDPGPYGVETGYYRLPASVMPDVLSDRQTELWAQVYYPTGSGAKPMPVIVVLHGNHGTCGTGSAPRIDDSCLYTTTGVCPPRYVVVPNHEGYGYFAERLASWGYYVVSINANRGITCGSGVSGDSGLNLARGRLVLKHLEKLSLWAKGEETPPSSIGMDPLNALDFGRVGLAGHSRGGEGVRAAYAQYSDPGSPWPNAIREPLGFAGIFEIGAVDGQTSRVLDAAGVPWHQVLPMCDGDVSDLQGVKPYDRMMDDLDELPGATKSTFAVWGANHNFFNTEWQTSDSPGCSGHDPLFPSTIGSPEQQQVGRAAAMAFFRTHLAAVPPDQDLLRNFDPLSDLPSVVSDITTVDRNFSLSPNGDTSPQLEDFSGATGRNMYGYRNLALRTRVSHGTVPEHDPSLRGASIRWTTDRLSFFQINWERSGGGVNATDYDTLDFRISRAVSSLNPSAQIPTDFSLMLISGDRSKSTSIKLSDYTDLLGPVGSTSRLHSILKTVRIPLSDFGDIDRSQLRSLRIVFDGSKSGEIYLSGIRLSRTSDPSVMTAAVGSIESNALLSFKHANPDDTVTLIADAVDNSSSESSLQAGHMIEIRRLDHASSLLGASGLEIELGLDGDNFPVRNALPVLVIGAKRFTISRYPDDGSTSRLIFTVPEQEYSELEGGEEIHVYYGDPSSLESNWRASFGRLIVE